MKPFPTLAALALAAILVGLFQQRELTNLRQRSAELGAGATTPAPDLEHQTGTAPPKGARETGAQPPAETAASRADAERAKLPVEIAASDLIRRAEEAIRSGSMLQVATELVPELNRASPEMLKAVLAQLNTADVPPEARRMAYSTILSKLVKTEPREAVERAFTAATELGEPFGSGIFRKVFQSWVETDPDAVETWFTEAMATGDIPSEPKDIYNYAVGEVAGLVAKRDLTEAWQRIEAEAGNLRAQSMMLDRARPAITSSADWEHVAELALSSEDAKLRNQTLYLLAPQNFKLGSPVEQIDRAAGIIESHPELGNIYAQNAFITAAETGSAQLADWALPKILPNQVESEIEHLVRTWTRRDPRIVEAWVQSMPPGELRDLVHSKAVGGGNGGAN